MPSSFARPIALSVALASLAFDVDAFAVEPPVPAHRITYDELTAVRVNPLGLESRYNLAWRSRLYEHDAAALRDNHVSIVSNAVLSPAFFRYGATVELKPLTLLTLSAGVHRIGYFGTFQFLQGYADALADFSDSEQRRATERGENYSTGGTEVELRAQALGKLGPIVVRSDTSFYYTDVGLRAGERLYYTPRYDLLMPDGGFAMTSDNDALYFSSFGLVAGVRATVATAFYDAAMLRGQADPNGPTVRVGPLVAYTFFDRPGAAFNKPTVFFNAGFWLAHRYRTGADVTQAFPLIAAGFRFEGELFRSR